MVRISRFGLAALFLFTAGAKLAILKTFAGNVAELLSSAAINYERWRWPVTIGVIAAEVLTTGLLIVPRTVTFGATIALGTISVAILSHLTKLGVTLPAVGDHGELFALAIVVLLCSGTLLLMHRKEIPILGKI